MVKNKRNKSRNKQASKVVARLQNGPGKPGRSRVGGGNPSSGFMDYFKLLADPCGGALVRAPYTGIGSGLVVRTRQLYNPKFSSINNLSTMDFAYEITPFNAPTSAVYGSNLNGALMTMTAISEDCFVTNPTIVKAFRPIAACVKWLPNGPIASRRGTIGHAYAPSKTVTTSGGYYCTDLLSSCAVTAANGSVSHETKWLPSFADERFGSASETDIVGAGSVLLVGNNVDCTAVPNGALFDVYLNGYLEVTTVWEWEPAAGGSVTTSKVVPSASPPSRTSLNDVLARISNIGNFLYGALDSVSMAYQYSAGGPTRTPAGFRLAW